ncbi:hypothetical protein IEQ44_00305 [Nocardioides sp. Y6]|uniref:DUF5655 domain-containing protein n=1 Tax=Nocardioides malaquae TaxID=2773426 RepID=A0ABR9RNX3_9ACTN|nr:DUF5655 domain-containing protein [Nocardioides malaquae]MBE7323090.1 hypothetical protein [Nocardioides malaquae]
MSGDVDVEKFFDGHPDGLACCLAVLDMASALPGVTVAVSRSQVAVRRRRGFAYVWRPGQYVANPVPAVLSLALSRRVDSPRFKEVVEPSPGHWMHHLELWRREDVDDEVSAWIREAWERAA